MDIILKQSKSSKGIKHHYILIMAAFMLLLTFPFTMQAAVSDVTDVQQLRTIRGVVVDLDDEPVPGVQVTVVGRAGGVLTNIDGEFSIEASSEESLQFFVIGMETLIVPVGDNVTLSVQMVYDGFELDEFIVTGFTRQRRSSVVSAITSVNPRELRIPSSNLTTALSGRVAGLIGIQTSGEPGADNAQFFIRGVTTFGYASAPLILLDGFQVSMDDLARMDPDNIESFQVLKDATAIALYGSQGANGVIIVTTRRGVSGQPRISFRAEGRMSQPTQIMQVADGITFMNLFNQAQFNDNPLLPPHYSAQRILNTVNNINPYAFPNIDWYDTLFRRATFNQHYNLNISGGGTAVRYFLSLTYQRDQGLLRNHAMHRFNNNISIDRYLLMSNITMDLTPTTVLDFQMDSRFERWTGPIPEARNVFAMAAWTNPVEFPKYFPQDLAPYAGHTLFGIDPSGMMVNPFAHMVSGYRDGSLGRIISQFTLNQNLGFITEGLDARVRASIRSESRINSMRSLIPYMYSVRNFDEITGDLVLQQVFQGRNTLSDPLPIRRQDFRLYVEAGLTYSRAFDDHYFSGLLIYTQEENTISDQARASTIQLTLPHRVQGLRSRVNYVFRDRYAIEASLTVTGSERFHEEYRWGVFPAMGLLYTISQEDFWFPISHIIPTLRLRYSIGQIGNDNIARAEDRFFFLSDIGSGPGFRWGREFTTNTPGFSIWRYANPLITWEVATMQNMGFEMDLFRGGAARLTLDHFRERRTQIYQERQNLPATMGLTSAVHGNVGEVTSRGWDGSIDLNHNISRDAWIQGRFNFTFAQNQIIQNEEPAFRWPHLSRIGWPIHTQQGFIAERLFIDEEDIRNSPRQDFGTIIRPGDIKYLDVNGDGVVNSDDRVHLGFPTIPEITYGFGLSTGWRNFDASFFMRGQARVSFFIDPGAGGIAPLVGQRNILQVIADDHWSPNNPVSHAFWPRLTTTHNENNSQYSTWWLRSGSLLRMQTMEFGYTLPRSLFGELPVETARIYLSGQNLFTLSSFDLWDPELGRSGFNYPLQRVYSIGLHMTF